MSQQSEAAAGQAKEATRAAAQLCDLVEAFFRGDDDAVPEHLRGTNEHAIAEAINETRVALAKEIVSERKPITAEQIEQMRKSLLILFGLDATNSARRDVNKLCNAALRGIRDASL